MLPHTFCMNLGNSSSLTHYYFLFSFVQLKCAKHVNPKAGGKLGILHYGFADSESDE